MPLAGHGLRPSPLRRWASRPQLKRDPLGTHKRMVNRDLTLDDLEPEFRRIGTSGYDALRLLVTGNHPPQVGPPRPPESVNVQIDVPLTLRVLRSLPDNAGAAAFVAALAKALGIRPPRTPDHYGGDAGA